MKKIIIVKLGRSISTNDENKIDLHRFNLVAKQIKEIQKQNMGVILVVSGSVTTGRQELGTDTDTITKNLYAAVGQSHVIAGLYKAFQKHSLAIGQLLLTRSDLRHKNKVKQVKELLTQAVKNNVVMILNENDAVDLGSFLGNDFLATEVARLMKAQSLILLTDVEGIYGKDMKVYERFKKEDLKNIADIESENTKGAVGGIKAKIKAAIDAKNAGSKTFIAYGRKEDVLLRLLVSREAVGTQII